MPSKARLIWPTWKVPLKGIFYFSAVAWLSTVIGHYSLIFAFIHQGIGLVGHLWFCRVHGFTWYAVEDPERYVALSKAAVGYRTPVERPTVQPKVLMPVNQACQCQGERQGVELLLTLDDHPAGHHGEQQ